jgi:hypothetical protein
MRRIARLSIAVALAAIWVAGAPTEARAANSGWFDFKKNASDQTSSRLRWFWSDNVTLRTSSIDLVRAGSGVNENECEIGKGWLPNGWYDELQMADHYNGTKIWGRVWQLQDKKCPNGTYRTELFVHTEETSEDSQTGCGSGRDAPQCWDGAGDYLSFGCIKAAWSADSSYSGIGYVHRTYHDASIGGDPGSGARAYQVNVHE